MEDVKTLEVLEKEAVLLMINFGKSFRSMLNVMEVTAVENCMEEAGCNTSIGRAERRRIEAMFILRDCIASTNRYELRKIKTALMNIANR